jgi:hypothetical protein
MAPEIPTRTGTITGIISSGTQMPGMPRGKSGRRPPTWGRKAVLLRRTAIGCYVAAVPLAGLALAWSRVAWLAAIVALLAGLWCERAAILARRLEDDQEEMDDAGG